MENWIAKFLINTEARLDLGQVNIDNSTFNIISISEFNFFKEIKSNEHFRLIEIIFEQNQNESIEAAYIRAQDKIEEFIDRFSFVSYSVGILKQCLSVSKEYVEIGKPFEIIYTHYFKHRTLNSISSINLNFDLDEKQRHFLRLLKVGMISNNYEEKLLRFYALIEQIALDESEETIKQTCSNCGVEKDTGNKKTNNYIHKILEPFGFSKKDLGNITTLRNKIAHGGGKRDQNYYLEVNKYGIMLEKPTYSLIIERIQNVKIQNDCNPQIHGYPFVKTSFKYINENEELEYIGWDFKNQFQMSIINAEKKNDAFVGIKHDGNNKPIFPEKFELPKIKK